MYLKLPPGLRRRHLALVLKKRGGGGLAHRRAKNDQFVCPGPIRKGGGIVPGGYIMATFLAKSNTYVTILHNEDYAK